jgi:hypothetical protein
MTASAVLSLAARQGVAVVLAPGGERLEVEGPAEAVDALVPTLAELKPELLAHLRGQAGGKILPFILPAPKAGPLLSHCVRVRPDSTVTPADVEALAAYFSTLGREAAIASERRLWVWWRATPHPSVTAFLAAEPKVKQAAGDRGKGAA